VISEPVYLRPIAWDLRKGKVLHRTVRFDSLYTLICGRRYKICASANTSADGSHLLHNVDTGEWRWVQGKLIREWIDSETV